MKVTYEEVCRAYPAPVTEADRVPATRQVYSVGGALCMTVSGERMWRMFPDRDAVSAALMVANSGLDQQYANHYASLIYLYSFAGHHERAWRLMREALDHPRI